MLLWFWFKWREQSEWALRTGSSASLSDKEKKRVPMVRLYHFTLPFPLRLTSRSVHATHRSISLSTEAGAVGEILGYQFWQGPQAEPKMDPAKLAVLTPNAEVTMSLPITWSLMDILVYSGLFQAIFKPWLSVTWAPDVKTFSWQKSWDHVNIVGCTLEKPI